MKITVLNGSPKGQTSVTLQYINYIRHEFPDNAMSVHDISFKIKSMEKEKKEFDAVLADVKKSDLIIWAFPLYYFLVPSQYKRFIELLFERKSTDVFKSKFAVVITTSIHFFDHLAHNYMRAICDDLGMRSVGSFSAAMYDLLNRKERKRLDEFVHLTFDAVEKNRPASRAYFPVSGNKFTFKTSAVKENEQIVPLSNKVLIMSDATGPSTNLGRMVERLQTSFTSKPETVNIRDLNIKGGCLGCMHCSYDNQCVYGESDGFHEFFETKVKTADIIFFCLETRDRYLSAEWKQFWDRSFYNNHVPVLNGKQISFLVSGPLAKLTALREFLQSYPGMHGANLVDIVTDEVEDSRELDFNITAMTAKAVAMAERHYVGPSMFPSIGGWKIFRDEIWSSMQFPFIADNKYYTKHNMYDFPKIFTKQRLMNSFLSFMVKIRGFRNEVYKKRMKDEMIKPLQSLLNSLPRNNYK